MTPANDLRIAARFTRWAQLASGLVVVMGAVVAFGWLAGIPALQRLHPTLPSMKLNTAIALVALGLALWFSIERRPTAQLARSLATVAIGLAGVSLAEHASGLDVGIDELLVRDPSATTFPGRMAPATAGCLVLLGAALLWLETRWAEWIALAVALFAHVALLGYLYGVHDLYAIGPYSSVALHTAVALGVLALAMLLARPRRGFIGVVTSASSAGILTRRLLPAAFVLPAVLALLRQWGEDAGLYGTGVGRAMLVASNSAIFVALIWGTAVALVRADRDRRAAEDAVRESEADLAITLESIGDAVIATDEHGRIKRMNAVAERLTGWTSAQARERPLSEVFRITDEDTGVTVDSPVDRVLRDGVVIGLTRHTVLTARDGTTRAITSSGAAIRNTEGATRGVVLVFQDHSAARAAERRLRDSDARKAAILESTLDAIISIDASSTILEFNSAAEAMFGRKRDEVIGTTLADTMIPPSLRNAPNSRLARLATGESSMVGNRNDVTAFRADGTAFPVEVAITHATSVDPPTFTVLLRDVTEPRRARAELIRSHDRLRTLASVSDAFATVATNYQLLLDKIARTSADLLGDGCVVMLISEDAAHLTPAASAHRDPAFEREFRLAGLALRTDGPSYSATVARAGRSMRIDLSPSEVATRTDPALRPMLAQFDVHGLAVVPIRVRGSIIGTLSLFRTQPGHSYTDEDVTLLQDLADRAGLAIENARLVAQLEQRVRARTAELEATNQDLEAFSYSVAHDLRAPLRAISGFSHALLEDYADAFDVAGRRYVTQIIAASSQMSRLVDDLLQLAKISRTELRRSQVDISALAHGVVARLRAAQPQREVEIAITPGLAAEADPRLLEVVLTNLLGNAWKFTSKREHARIELSVRPDERPTVYVVRDNGAGFAPENAGKLFAAFQRLHSDREFEGSGIGLATVQRIIHSHGGRIWAEAEVDKGATFYFTLAAQPG